jgi:hypothetical protein
MTAPMNGSQPERITLTREEKVNCLAIVLAALDGKDKSWRDYTSMASGIIERLDSPPTMTTITNQGWASQRRRGFWRWR